jgi:hypothetical protein
MQKEQIETILKINGVAPTSPDEEIRSVLLSARFNKDEVDAAIMILRENVITNETRVDGLHKVFRSDRSLKPQEISRLLGVDVDIDEITVITRRSRDLSPFQYAVVWFLAIILALGGIATYMYNEQVGPFHPSVMR